MMTEDEHNDAVRALIRWLKSQNINPVDTVPICATTICVAILSLEPSDQAGAEASARLAGDLIRRGIKSAWKNIHKA